jgi:hypothetical protein
MFFPLRQLAGVARRPASSSLFWVCSEVAVSDDVVTQKQGFAIFYTRVPAHTTRLTVLHPYKNQIFLEGEHRGASLRSPGLHRTHQQSAQVIVQNMYCTYIGLL